MIKQEQAEKFLGKHEPKELKEADLASFSAPIKSWARILLALWNMKK